MDARGISACQVSPRRTATVLAVSSTVALRESVSASSTFMTGCGAAMGNVVMQKSFHRATAATCHRVLQ